ncbi:hypothetical protein DCO58_12120 [Helicobacter saguini]|uniref:Uncharacterized protein n=1 Tax=Helicobacter saguini TaxID=1548018 RepID=A0A099BAL0_9HELI|nr:hypothetical protein [Helicobacter saguini]MWV60965.1 hypothetical protein [Helicobacter saguini]MWV68367.1 hypothetical protein [Helicobacter saguini]MWV70169.1 hypothetical protein [Helicobacter saguini]MWV72072.1 hypothetical protein [Helicobacter saguini]TLD93707.1 hypothetical protein LS64_007900 [Helicobacter saguini]
MTIILDTKDDFNAEIARKIRKMLLVGLIVYYVCVLLSIFVGGVGSDEDVESFSSYRFYSNPYSEFLDREINRQYATKNDVSMLPTIINFIGLVATIYFLVGVKKLSNFTCTPLFRYFVSGIILCVMYVVFIVILFFSVMDSDNVGLRGLSAAFGGIISLAFMIYTMYLQYKIADAFRQISGLEVFMRAFKFIVASDVIITIFFVYFISSLLWNGLNLASIFDGGMGWLFLVLFSSILSFIAQILFILGVYSIKSMNVRN